MTDIKALSKLSEQSDAFKRVSNPPVNVNALDTYEKGVKKVIMNLYHFIYIKNKSIGSSIIIFNLSMVT